MQLAAVALVWIVWCCVHSLMVTRWFTGAVRRRWATSHRWYRLAYNAIALVSLVAASSYADSIDGPVLLAWEGRWQVLRGTLMIGAIALFVAGAQQYDLVRFAGFRQLVQPAPAEGLAGTARLDTGGVLRMTRHPWYLGALLVLWTGPEQYTAAGVVAAAILSGYVLVGTWLEERKLVSEFGEAYRDYQREVSALVPTKWVLRRLRSW